MAVLSSKRGPTTWLGCSPCCRPCLVAHLLLHAPFLHCMELYRSNVPQNTVSQREKWGNDHKKPCSKHPNFTTPQAFCYLAPFCARGTLLGLVCRGKKKEPFQAENTKFYYIFPKQIPADKKIIFTLPISSLLHFIGILASWTRAYTPYAD